MEGEDGQALLQLRFAGFILLLGQLSTAEGFQGIFYLGTRLRHLERVECVVEEVGRACPNLATYIMCYSEFHVFFDV